MSIDFDRLFDADTYWRSGKCPWTFFAYPTRLAESNGLPPNDEAKQLLEALQRRGVCVGIWHCPVVADTTYFACPETDIHALNSAIAELEAAGTIEQEFFAKRAEYLFALVKPTI